MASSEQGEDPSVYCTVGVLCETQWTPVVRYDTAHGFAHRDLYTRQGKQFKTPLGMDFNQARTFAQRDLLVNWQEYRRIFLGE
jgi:hypothetical protein